MSNTPQPFTLFDPNTAECPTPAELLKNIAELTDDQVLSLLERGTILARDLTVTVSTLSAVITERMKARGATLGDTENFTAKLESASVIDYNEEYLRFKLRPLLSIDGFKKLFVSQDDKLDRRELVRLEKLGGEFKTIITDARDSHKGPPKFSYERKPESKPESTVPQEAGTSVPAD